MNLIMKTGIAGLLLMALLAACKSGDEEKFTVNGKVKAGEAKMIYLEETPVATMQRNKVDSAMVDAGGNFTLRTTAREQTIYNLRKDDDVYPFISLVNDANKVKVEVDFTNQGDFYTISGSEASSKIKEYLMKSGEFMRAIYYADRQMDSLKNAGTPADSLSGKVYTRNKQAMELVTYTNTSIREAGSPALALFILSTYQGIANNPGFGIEPFDNEQVGSMLNHLLGKFPEHQGLASVKTYFDSQTSGARGWVGKQAPSFTLPDMEGNPVSLDKFRGQYVLVDFWASWCRPCREENPNVVNAYNTYKDKNFTILGVSLDRNKEPWMKAVVTDKLNWTHVSDLQEWRSSVVPLYNIRGIPFNVLVDPNGKVIAENLRGEQLDKKLQQVLN